MLVESLGDLGNEKSLEEVKIVASRPRRGRISVRFGGLSEMVLPSPRASRLSSMVSVSNWSGSMSSLAIGDYSMDLSSGLSELPSGH